MPAAATETFNHFADRFADIQVLRYQIPGFDALDLDHKKLIYYLAQAAASGRDIYWDQNYRYNLCIRKTLDELVRYFRGDRQTPDWAALMVYVKRVWFSSGIHHHYSMQKFTPDIPFETFASFVRDTPDGRFPIPADMDLEAFLQALKPIMFDPNLDAKKVNKDEGADLVADSAVNFYVDVTQDEVTAYHQAQADPGDPTPPSYGLNSTLVKRDGQLVEDVWKVGGKYTEAIEQMVHWLEKAVTVAQSPAQAEALNHLINFYKTGDLRTFDAYNIAWLADTQSTIDTINGFIEVYDDPLGYRATFEALVSMVDAAGTQRIDTVARNAQWFEDHSPILDQHKKEAVKGVTGRAINVVTEAGACSPTTPIGINLPNADWIRERHGSKSVNLSNIVTAFNKSSGGLVKEFAYSAEEKERAQQFGDLSDDLHTDLHEVIGHASGKLEPGVATPKEMLKNYQSTLEEARADLVALYFIMDPKLIELDLMPSFETGKAQFDHYIRNGLMVQLRRLKPGENLEEDHMRNRQLIAQWAYQHGREDNVIEKVVEDGKTYFVIRDYTRLRELFGQLLRQIQTIKSKGDFEAGKALVERYGVKVDPDLHAEVLDRFAKLNLAPYHGMLNPKLMPEMDEAGTIQDIKVHYPETFTEQMIDYGILHGHLKVKGLTYR